MSPSALEIAKRLVALPSLTPQDRGCQRYMAQLLEPLGFVIQPLRFGAVDNLWARHGTEAPLLVFLGHTDVVPPGNLPDWHSPPFEPTVKEGHLFGRGTADMKGGIAAMIAACGRFLQKQTNYPGSIAFLLTSDEEGPALDGTARVLETLKIKQIQIDACLVGEPASEKELGDFIKQGHRGSLNGHLKILGRQGHVAQPKEAKNAIHVALAPLLEWTALAWDKGNGDFSPTTFQLSNIQAGTGAPNVIPGLLECDFNFRFSPELSPIELQTRVTRLLDNHDLTYELSWQPPALPFLSKKKRLAHACIEAIQEIKGFLPQFSTEGGTSDGRFMVPLGIETLELGLCNQTIHAVNESVSVQALEELSRIYEQVLTHYFYPNVLP